MPPASSGMADPGATAAAAHATASSTGLPVQQQGAVDAAGMTAPQHGDMADPPGMEWWDTLPMVVPDYIVNCSSHCQ
jgi:hypothetical protein